MAERTAFLEKHLFTYSSLSGPGYDLISAFFPLHQRPGVFSGAFRPFFLIAPSFCCMPTIPTLVLAWSGWLSGVLVMQGSSHVGRVRSEYILRRKRSASERLMM